MIDTIEILAAGKLTPDEMLKLCCVANMLAPISHEEWAIGKANGWCRRHTMNSAQEIDWDRTFATPIPFAGWQLA